MPGKNRRMLAPGLWELAKAQHGVVARQQLLALGVRSGAIERRIAAGRLHPLMQGVYAVGRPGVTARGRWMAAVLCCDPHATESGDGVGAVLSHGTAAVLWGISTGRSVPVHVSIRSAHSRRRPGVVAHRRPSLRPTDLAVRDGIPTTGVVQTLVDMATLVDAPRLERAVNEADRLDLIDPDSLRAAPATHDGRRGVRQLRDLLDRRTFRLTASELEQRFLRLRDQAHASAGLTPLRFTHAQVSFDPAA
jgi:hypothetical protein